MCERGRRESRVEANELLRLGLHRDMVASKGLFHLISGGLEDLGRMDPTELGGYGVGVDSRHLENVLEQAAEALDFCEDQITLLAAIHLLKPRGLEVARRDTDRGERRSQVVA